MSEVKKIDNIMHDSDNIRYYPCIGLYPSNIPIFTPLLNDIAKNFFKILNDTDLEYYVFAGTAIGYVRNKASLPWTDDYDIIMFKNQLDIFRKKVIPMLEFNGFKVSIKFHKDQYVVKMKANELLFMCDIFTSYVNVNGQVKSIDETWGNYNYKNVMIEHIKPAKYYNVDGMRLPFFNKLEYDVKNEYGDVFNNVIINKNHKGWLKINARWEDVYARFNENVNNAISYTKKCIYTNKNYIPKNNRTLSKHNKFKTHISILRYISENNVKNLYITDNSQHKYVYAIKYYYPQCNIILYINEDLVYPHIVFNYVDTLYFKDISVMKKYMDPKMVYFNKPKFDLINIITLGTFDFYHSGHKNIISKAAEYSNNITVGVSSDELNEKKGKKSHYTTMERVKTVKSDSNVNKVFVEESLDKKNDYIKKYSCNLLVMGDDWKGNFDWVSCGVIYFPRTPGISSTLLRKQIAEGYKI